MSHNFDNRYSACYSRQADLSVSWFSGPLGSACLLASEHMYMFRTSGILFYMQSLNEANNTKSCVI